MYVNFVRFTADTMEVSLCSVDIISTMHLIVFCQVLLLAWDVAGYNDRYNHDLEITRNNFSSNVFISKEKYILQET